MLNCRLFNCTMFVLLVDGNLTFIAQTAPGSTAEQHVTSRANQQLKPSFGWNPGGAQPSLLLGA